RHSRRDEDHRHLDLRSCAGFRYAGGGHDVRHAAGDLAVRARLHHAYGTPLTMLELRLTQQSPIPLDAQIRCETGELLALVGPSGSGKSTILKTIACLMRGPVGRIVVN